MFATLKDRDCLSVNGVRYHGDLFILGTALSWKQQTSPSCFHGAEYVIAFLLL